MPSPPRYYMDRKCLVADSHEQAPALRYYVTGNCAFCAAPQAFYVDAAELHDLRRGTYLAAALQSNTADEREFLLSGCCPHCWGKVVPAPDAPQETYGGGPRCDGTGWVVS